MSENIKQVAMIEASSNIVANVVAVEGDEKEMQMSGFYFVSSGDDVFCEPGMYYNPADDLFYFDAALTQLTRPDRA